jgi:uncharacterized protein
MDVTGVALDNLLSPVILFFALGMLAGLLKSDLAIPEPVGKLLALYLVIAIGLKGGIALGDSPIGGAIAVAAIVAVALSLLLPFVGYALLRASTRLDATNAAAVAAHYGSVSVVTFAAATVVLAQLGVPFEAYMIVLLVAMEAPAIVSGLFLARQAEPAAEDTVAPGRFTPALLREVFLSGTVLLLLGSLGIGWLTGGAAARELGPVFETPFKGILCLFLLDMGLTAARRLGDLRHVGWGVAAFGIYMPLCGAALGLAAGWALGLSVGGTTLFAVLGASASYIVVPATMRVALPKASPAVYLTLALGITFPFNLLVGIPLYHAGARAIDSMPRPVAIVQALGVTATGPAGETAAPR